MAKSKAYINYKIEPYPDDPFQAKLIKFTNNPDYSFEMTFRIVKKGVFYFIQLMMDYEKTAYAKRKNDIPDICGRDDIYTDPNSFAKVINKIVNHDVRDSIWHSMQEAGKKGGFKPKQLRPNAVLNKRIKKKCFAFAHNLSKLNEHWSEAFSRKSRIFSGLITIGYDDDPGSFILPHIVQRESEKMTKVLEERRIFEDIENIYCFRKYIEKNLEARGAWQNRRQYRGDGFLSKVLNGWESVLNAGSGSKKRVIGTWPNIATGIEHLPAARFNRNVKNKLEIRSHLAYFGATDSEGDQAEPFFRLDNGNGEQRPYATTLLRDRIEHIVLKASNEEIKRAYRCFRLHRRETKRVSYERLYDMYTHIVDSMRIYQHGNCSAEFHEEFESAISNANSLKRVVELCNLIHRNNLSYAMKQKLGAKARMVWPWPIINPNFEKNGAVVTFLENADEVHTEGQKMHHCVGSYVQSAVEGYKIIFHVEYEGEEATVSLNRSNGYDWAKRRRRDSSDSFTFGQSYGPHNKRNKASEKGESLLRAWMHKYNSIILSDKSFEDEENKRKIKEQKKLKINKLRKEIRVLAAEEADDDVLEGFEEEPGDDRACAYAGVNEEEDDYDPDNCLF